MPECDMDDLLCQMQVLVHLKGIQTTLGGERFRATMPELVNLASTLPERIASQERTLEENMRSCGMLKQEEKIGDFGPIEEPLPEPE